MMRGLLRWLRSWRRSWRYTARSNDAKFLWPTIWSVCGGSVLKFIDAACVHTALDPNWRGHEPEWQLTPVDPATWVAMRVSAGGPVVTSVRIKSTNDSVSTTGEVSS